jgi:hypothetical protein
MEESSNDIRRKTTVLVASILFSSNRLKNVILLQFGRRVKMSKLTIICAALMLIICSGANAVQTDTVTDSMTLDSGWLGPDATYNWTHTLTFEPPPAHINSATLDIVAFDVSVSQGDIIPVTLDGINLGNLVQGNTNEWNTSSFSLSSSALAELTDESATISVTVASGKQIKIKTSTLTIDYTLSTNFADYGSGTTTQLFAGGAVWKLNWAWGVIIIPT